MWTMHCVNGQCLDSIGQISGTAGGTGKERPELARRKLSFYTLLFNYGPFFVRYSRPLHH
jgi:hypothetical protein